MFQAQGVDIAALISQLEDDYNIFGHHFISRMKQVNIRCEQTPIGISIDFYFLVLRKGSHKKNGYFTVRLTVRGGGGQPPRPDRSICENFMT